MPKIKPLPPELISKIAAGEVVERPSSVVKELVENAVDAGAKNITVEIDLGGAALIRVTDDGLGMSRDDACLSVQAHTTSKIEKFEDLYNIRTLGFRGEALASIAAVAQFSLQTKPRDALAGTLISRQLTDQWQAKDVGCHAGTQITVKNLFYNVPGRRKFLRSAMTEYQHTLELLESLALLWPEVGFKFVSNGKTVFDWPSQSFKERCQAGLGGIFKDFLPVEYQSEFTLSGWIGRPALAKPRRLQYLFINNRVVSDFMLARAVREAYGDLIAKDCHPVYVLKADLPAGQVDVNVHPRKSEVKIAESHKFYREVNRVISAALGGLGMKDMVVSVPQASMESPYKTQMVRNNGKVGSWTPVASVFNGSMLTFPDRPMADMAKPRFTVLGQLDCSYIIVLTESALLIFDQHAVSERLRYTELKESAGSLSQTMLHPMAVDLPISEYEIFVQNQAGLSGIGWRVEPFGDRTVIVRAIPTAVKEAQARSILSTLLRDMEKAAAPEDLLKSMACHTSVRFGDTLSLPEQEILVRQAFEKNVQSCPHGRPAMYKLEVADLEKVFKRRT